MSQLLCIDFESKETFLPGVISCLVWDTFFPCLSFSLRLEQRPVGYICPHLDHPFPGALLIWRLRNRVRNQTQQRPGAQPQ